MTDLESLRNRRYGPDGVQLRHFSKAASVDNDSYDYLIEATRPIDEEYTNATFVEGDRVRSQLQGNLDAIFSAEFEYQGSVTSDTHVERHSDIDLLVLHGNYTTFPAGVTVPNPVSEDVVTKSLNALRKDSSAILKVKFAGATIDESGSKAVSVSGGSLARDVDVVVGHWWNTPDYLAQKVLANRGVKILDANNGGRIENMPFLHNLRIDNKDLEVGGGLRKAIRLLKNLKYDKKASLSSYDITALAFNMKKDDLAVSPGQFLKLAKKVSGFLNGLIADSSLRNSLDVPNKLRKVFGTDGATLDQLKQLTALLDGLLSEISQKEAVLINFSESLGTIKSASAEWQEPRAQRVREFTERFLRAA